uniref:TATA-binding protein interacting (TIP20) domain-containing protein n=1 Tax=Aureoumbra lagunensis TaxID=44058 RepID=A0A7S3NKS9_9STRA
MDVTMERRICAAALKQLDDQSSDVQSISVKALGVLLKKVHKAQVGEIAEKLCSLILDGKDELRDIYSIGLKTLVKDMPVEMGPSVCEKLTQRLLGGVQQKEKLDVKLEALDNLTDLLKRFGHQVEADHAQILHVVLAQLKEKPVARKRAAACLAALAQSASDTLLEELFGTLLANLESSESFSPNNNEEQQLLLESSRTQIQTIGTIARAVGGRLGRRLDAIVPVFLKHVGNPNFQGMTMLEENVPDMADDDDDDEDNQALRRQAEHHASDEINELRDNCFQGLESFVLRCPTEIEPHLDGLIHTSLGFACYDPNYNYDDEENNDDLDEEEDDDDDDDDDDYDEYEDEQEEDEDDDSSWKVRRAALRLLTAIITSRSELLSNLYNKAAPILTDRFKEREENVRVDVIKATESLIRITPDDGSYASQIESLVPALISACSKQIIQDGIQRKLSNSALAALAKKKTNQTAFSKNEKAKAACYSLLRVLCSAVSLQAHATEIANMVKLGLSERSQSLRLDAGRLLRATLDAGALNTENATAGLVDKVASLVREDWYKLIAEGLRLVASLALTPGLQADAASTLYEAATWRLKASDVDHEIKECAIHAVAALARHPEATSQAFLVDALGLLLDKARAESTRPAALRALAQVAAAKVDISSIFVKASLELAEAGLAISSSRALKQLTLETLLKFADAPGAFPSAQAHKVVPQVLKKAASLISDEDLHLAQLATKLAVAVIKKGLSDSNANNLKSALQVATDEALVSALGLLRSPLVQGPVLSALGELFVVLCVQLGHYTEALSLATLEQKVSSLAVEAFDHHASNDDAMDLSEGLTSSISSPRADRQILANAASALAALTADAADISTRQAKIQELVAAVRGEQNATPATTRLATLCLGELGRRLDLSDSPFAFEVLMAAALGKLSPALDEEGKSRAALSLGLVAAGAVATFVPPLLDALEAAALNGDEEYLLLVATKQCISLCDSSETCANIASMADRLSDRVTRSCDVNSEQTRTMVADCLGAMAPIAPRVVALRLDQMLARPTPPPGPQESGVVVVQGNDDPDTRAHWTAAAALRQACSLAAMRSLSLHTDEFNREMGSRLATALNLVDEKHDLTVRRQALVMLNACAHHKPELVAPLAAEAVPKLRAVVDLRLERVVDLGPFKHRIDDAKDLRKAAVACAATFLDNASSGLAPGSHMPPTPSAPRTVDPDGDADMTPISSAAQLQAQPYVDVAAALVPVAVAALGDKLEDIQMTAHSLLAKLGEMVPDAVAEYLKEALDHLDKTVNKKITAKTGTEADRAYDLIRSGLKAALSLTQLRTTRNTSSATAFIEKAMKKDKLAVEINHLQSNDGRHISSADSTTAAAESTDATTS